MASITQSTSTSSSVLLHPASVMAPSTTPSRGPASTMAPYTTAVPRSSHRSVPLHTSQGVLPTLASNLLTQPAPLTPSLRPQLESLTKIANRYPSTPVPDPVYHRRCRQPVFPGQLRPLTILLLRATSHWAAVVMTLLPSSNQHSPQPPFSRRKYWLLSGYESEDLGHAIALSLSEEELTKSISTRTKSNVDEDELARALQESLNTKSPPPENKESPRFCAGCEKELGLGEFLSLMGALWHPDCFSCYACCQPIIGHDFSIYGDHPYHKSCFRNLYHPKCDVCKEFMPVKNGKIEYQKLPFWMQMSCPSHEHDGTQDCFSCHRRVPQGANSPKLDDRVIICLECLDSSIMNSAMCQPLYGDILKFYKGLNMDFDRGEIQLLLVESRVLLSEVQDEEGCPPPDKIMGHCLLNTQNAQIKYKRPKISIFILKGLPRILTGLNLAHEMMHAWLRLNGYGKLDPRVEEGICVVLSYMWLDIEMRSGSDNNDVSSSSSSSPAPYRKGPRSQFERKFGEYCKLNLENQPYPIYADGFRLGHAAVIKYGLRSVLDHIKLTGNFPC